MCKNYPEGWHVKELCKQDRVKCTYSLSPEEHRKNSGKPHIFFRKVRGKKKMSLRCQEELPGLSLVPRRLQTLFSCAELENKAWEK